MNLIYILIKIMLKFIRVIADTLLNINTYGGSMENYYGGSMEIMKRSIDEELLKEQARTVENLIKYLRAEFAVIYDEDELKRAKLEVEHLEGVFDLLETIIVGLYYD